MFSWEESTYNRECRLRQVEAKGVPDVPEVSTPLVGLLLYGSTSGGTCSNSVGKYELIHIAKTYPPKLVLPA